MSWKMVVVVMMVMVVMMRASLLLQVCEMRAALSNRCQISFSDSTNNKFWLWPVEKNNI